MSEPEAPPRAFRLRWYSWASATAILLVATPILFALAYRAAGFRRFDAELARERARGLATTIDDLIALAPAVDAARQARWRKAMDGLNATGANALGLSDAEFADLAAGLGIPNRVRIDREKAAAAMADVRALLREGPLVATGFGWMREHFARGDRSVTACASLPLPNLLAMRTATTWLEVEALTGDDPSATLDDLDRLVAALAAPTTLIDACIGIAAGYIRDETYLRCAILGRLPAARCDRWCNERPTYLVALADGMRGERILFNATIVDAERQQGLSLSGVGGPGERLRTRLDWYIWTGDGGARVAAVVARFEERWRGLRPDAPRPNPPGAALGLAGEPNGAEAGLTAWQATTRHRLMRHAARMLATSAIADIDAAFASAAAHDPQLETGSDHAALRYERLDAQSFRLTLDPASPAPDFVDAARVRGELKAGAPPTLMGQPPRRVPLVLERANVEVLLPHAAPPQL